MGGVYRIQTFFGFLYFFYIYKAPKQPCVPVESQSGDATETVARIKSLCRWGRFSQLCCH